MVKEKQKELSKEDSKMIQGLSVIAMVWLHLFCTLDYEGKFVPLLYFQGMPLSFYIAQLCDFCVFGFAFCSGYGHMAQYGAEGFYKRRLKGLLSVLCSYWCVLLVFSLISILFGRGEKMPGDVITFLLTAGTLKSSYNGAWWYMFAYVVLTVLSPVILKCVNKFNPVIVLGIGFIVYCTAYYVRFYMPADNWFLEKYGPVGMTFFEYLIGAVCCRHQVFSKIYDRWIRFPKGVRCGCAAVLFIGMLYGHTKIIGSLFIAPATGFIIITLFQFWKKSSFMKRFFLFIGRHSTNIWLMHMFFYVGWRGVYVAKYPLLIMLLMMVVTVSISFVFQMIEKPVQKVISRI